MPRFENNNPAMKPERMIPTLESRIKNLSKNRRVSYKFIVEVTDQLLGIRHEYSERGECRIVHDCMLALHRKLMRVEGSSRFTYVSKRSAQRRANLSHATVR